MGVLAHEVSHITHNEIWVMGLADLFSRLTAVFSTLGQAMLIVYLPVALFSGIKLNWGALTILVLSPTASILLQLALSRAREYDANLGAVS